MYPNGQPYSQNRQPYAMANYFLGIGPLPPPTPQEHAVANMNRALDSGAFDGTQCHPQSIPQMQGVIVPHQGAPAKTSIIKVQVPQLQSLDHSISSKKSTKPKALYVTLKIDTQEIEPQDFLD
ncbi:hypothetical protein BT96DRAFT_946304 [Gymnopus androsaceus JB14]|uniref:Uncharacterized protein n=1 Tax=Gymnopus androsaceus JB14 TaxID=1447944 RepID=A0A6A4GYQ8_9AGAR|nr:hypothetical protein BT96DRAFT_946304 [Gymnopus androsaceus JB14]